MVLVVKNPPVNAGDIRDTGSIPGLGRSPGGGQPTPEFLPGKNGQRSLQSSGLLWQATVHRVAKSLT